MATYGTFVDGVSLKASELNTIFTSTSFTPVLRQSGTVTTSTVGRSGLYQQVNKIIFCTFRLQATGAGTANNRIELDLPLTASSNADRVIGHCVFYDQSASDIIRLAAVRVSTTRIAFLADSSTSLTTYLGQTGGPTLTIASGDRIFCTVRYELP